ncbi:hypothetical protein [Candidatus Tisiphia endosymbiont of Ditula angustiorana]|uniref:hypothetical protein n=1 Tax=Candidatus Tisiphia endosymbiont of Ditula angustiorana TaxID=3066272 RepID=UPI00312CAC4D
MSKDKLTQDNKEKLRETALRLGISEDEVFSKVPPIILLGAAFNPKALGGFLKNMQPNMTSEEVLRQQIVKVQLAV